MQAYIEEAGIEKTETAEVKDEVKSLDGMEIT